MNEMDQKWRERRADYWNEALRYFRLIGNSGFMFAIVAAFIIGSYYYSVFLDWLPASFPTALVFAVITGFLLARSPIRTFIKEPDLVFLLPLETKMAGYFRKSQLYCYALQSFTMVVVMFILSPLFYARIADHTEMFFLYLVILLLVKYWNIVVSWREMYVQDGRVRVASLLFRAALSFAFAWLLFLHAPIYLLLALAAVMVLSFLFYYQPLTRKQTLKWERLLEVEEGRLMAFYRIANMFTEVPRIKNRVKARRWLTPLVSGQAFTKSSVYTSLFWKTFLRANDYFGTYVRLVVVGGLVLWLLPAGYGRPIVFLLVLYLTGMQLLALWRHPSGGMWEHLYPVPAGSRARSFKKFVLKLLIVEAIVFGVVLVVSGADVWRVVAEVALGLIVSILFASFYLSRKMSKAAI